MSKIDELLKNEKVEWKKLGEVCEFQRGQAITKKDIIDGKIPVIAGGQKPAYYHGISNRNGITIAVAGSGAYAGFVSYWEQPIFLSDAFSVEPNESLNKRYLYHWLLSVQHKIFALKQGSGIPHVYGKDLGRFEIPIPSLKTQEKIVKTLDKFTNHVTELQVELQVELQDRTKQYEYYRDLLLNEGYLNKISEKIDGLEKHNKIFFAKISDLCLRQKGINITAEKMKELNKENAPVKIFAGGNTTANVDAEVIELKNIINKPSVIVKSRGNIDFEYYDKPFSHKNEMWSYSTLNDEVLDIKFLFYILKNNLKYFKDNSISGKLPQISTGTTDNYEIPVPDIKIQNKVVEILDKFQSMLSDTKGLLPQEIEKRQKQYEYYREKLLTFDLEYSSKQDNI